MLELVREVRHDFLDILIPVLITDKSTDLLPNLDNPGLSRVVHRPSAVSLRVLQVANSSFGVFVAHGPDKMMPRVPELGVGRYYKTSFLKSAISRAKLSALS